MNSLDQLMAHYERGLNDLPILFFPDENTHSATGIDLTLFLLWAYTRSLLEEGLAARLSDSRFDASLSFADLVREARATLGDGFRPSNFNEHGRPFALKYLRPGWDYRYHGDLDSLFPDEKTYADVPESQETIDKVFAVLDLRREQFQKIASAT